MKPLAQLLTWLTLLAQAVYVAVVWRGLPAVLPSHFGVDGHPDGYASRYFLWFLVGLSSLLAIGLDILQQFPRTFNLPKPVGDPARPRLEALAKNMLLCIRLEITCLFAFLIWSIVRSGTGKSAGLGGSFIFIVPAVLLLSAGYFIWRMKSPRA